MKYDASLTSVQQSLPASQNILIVLPKSVNVDQLAAGLALYLALKQAGKEASIVTEATILVEHTNLFGVGKIQNQIPKTQNGDFILTLGGVVASDGKIPAVEKMDYFPKGNDLNLVFKVIPGQTFNPTFITPSYSGQKFDLIFILGAGILSDLGSLYQNNQQVFSSSHLINVNNSQGEGFGNTNILDPQASSLSEILTDILEGLKLPIDQDIATNLLTGIFSSTSNLTSEKVSADTYQAVAQALKAGGKRPNLAEASLGKPSEPIAQSQAQPQVEQGFDLSKIFQAPVGNTTPQPSPEEQVSGEEVVTPEDDWLTPKIFRGKDSVNG